MLTIAFIEAGVIIRIGNIAQRDWIQGRSDNQSCVCLCFVRNTSRDTLALSRGKPLSPGLKVSEIPFGYNSEFTVSRLN